MNAKISVFVIFVEAIIYLLLYHLHDCIFKDNIFTPCINSFDLRDFQEFAAERKKTVKYGWKL